MTSKFNIKFCCYDLENSSPILTVNPQAKKFISLGGKANLTCKAAGIRNSVITWYKDGIPVPEANITEALHQGGEYWCKAKNSHGWSRSSSTIPSMKQSKLVQLDICSFKVLFFSCCFFFTLEDHEDKRHESSDFNARIFTVSHIIKFYT